VDGKQLLCESLYLYGVMLILLDERIEGVIRERILISYLRYKVTLFLKPYPNNTQLILTIFFSRVNPRPLSSMKSVNFVKARVISLLPLQILEEDLQDILRNTFEGLFFQPNNNHHTTQPPSFSSKNDDINVCRCVVPKKFVEMVIGRLRSDDVYNQILAYPLPEHRSAALATQACMLYVVLYFAPHILHEEQVTLFPLLLLSSFVYKHFHSSN
jgi:WASH complex subunit strumpellin